MTTFQDACCDASGGRVTITIDGKHYSSRGGVRIMPSVVSKSVGMNDDGTMYTTSKAVPARAEFTLSDKCGLDPTQLIRGCKVDVTVDQIDMRRKWLYTQATVLGDPTIDSDSGAISGLSVASPFPQMIPY